MGSDTMENILSVIKTAENALKTCDPEKRKEIKEILSETLTKLNQLRRGA